jgi:hypothetical protein
MQTTPQLKDFLNRHAGETAWVFGKGPTLNSFDMRQAGPLRCAVNDVVARVPDCTYAFANDSVAAWQDVYEPHHTLFTPRRTLKDWFLQPVVPACNVVVFDDCYNDGLIPDAPPEQLAESLAIRRGTLGSLVQILWIMGVRDIITVGIDGGQAHADGQWRTRLRNDHWKDYNAIRDQFITTCDLYGIKLEMFAHNQLRKPKMRVRITRNCFVRDLALSANQIIDLPPQDASALVYAGAAVIERAVLVAEYEQPAPPVEVKQPAPAPKRARKSKAA